MGLITSSLDIDDKRVHGFAQWLSNDKFLKSPRRGDVTPYERFGLMQPVKFHDFSLDKQNNYCGYGIKSI
jgi:hypothetical protein